MLDIEYPSVIRAWQVAGAVHGGSVQLVHLDSSIGSADDVVDPANAGLLAGQWSALHGLATGTVTAAVQRGIIQLAS